VKTVPQVISLLTWPGHFFLWMLVTLTRLSVQMVTQYSSDFLFIWVKCVLCVLLLQPFWCWAEEYAWRRWKNDVLVVVC